MNNAVVDLLVPAVVPSESDSIICPLIWRSVNNGISYTPGICR